MEAQYKAHVSAILAIPEAEITFDNTIFPMMCPPHFKTNPLVCQSKHLQHCSTDAVVREAADKATGVFAKLKVRSDQDHGALVRSAVEGPARAATPQRYLPSMIYGPNFPDPPSHLSS